jgi:hypothetical protein
MKTQSSRHAYCVLLVHRFQVCQTCHRQVPCVMQVCCINQIVAHLRRTQLVLEGKMSNTEEGNRVPKSKAKGKGAQRRVGEAVSSSGPGTAEDPVICAHLTNYQFPFEQRK